MCRPSFGRIRASRTRIYLAFLGAIGMLLLGCGISDQLVTLVQIPTPTPANTATPIATRITVTAPTATPLLITGDCSKATNPTEQDVRYALEFTGNTFDPEVWDRSYTVASMRVDVSWISKEKRRVAFLENLIYSCGFIPTDWDYVLADRTFREVLFSGYQNLNRIASCTQNETNLRLVEFTAQHSQRNYWIRFWAILNGSTRLLTMFIAFPEESKIDFDRYSSLLFPALYSCPR